METVIVGVDNHNINATHFASFKKETAVKKMIQDGITKSKEWAERAWKESRKAVAEKMNMTEEQMDTVAQQNEDAEKLTEINRTRAATGAEPLESLDDLGAQPTVNNSTVKGAAPAQKQQDTGTGTAK